MQIIFNRKKYLSFVAITIITIMSLLFSCQKKNDDMHSHGEYNVYKNLIEEYQSIEQSDAPQKAHTNAPEIMLSNGKITQPFHTSFDYYALVPSDCQLYVKLQKGHRRVSGFVEIQRDGSEAQRFQFDKNGSHQVDLSPWEGKHILRKLLSRYVPSKLFERPKMGFGVPIGPWLRGPLSEWADDLISVRRLREEGHFDPTYVRKLWETHASGREDRHYELWDILMFQAWLDAESKTTSASSTASASATPSPAACDLG